MRDPAYNKYQKSGESSPPRPIFIHRVSKNRTMFKKNPNPNNPPPERRRYVRINKNFIMTYCLKSSPQKKIEITQLKNIGLGGMCFITTQKFEPSTLLQIELKTPYITDTTLLEGHVLESHEKIINMLYETRLEFVHINTEAQYLLTQLMEYFINGEKKQNTES